MTHRRVELRVEPLERRLLDGVSDPHDESRRMPVDVGVIPWFEDERPLQGMAGFLDWRSNGELSALVRDGWCCGAVGESSLLPWGGGVPVRRVVLVGFGRLSHLDAERAAAAASRAVAIANRMLAEDVLFAMPARVQERSLIEVIFESLASALERGDGRQEIVAPRFRPLVPARSPEQDDPERSDEVDEEDEATAVVAELHPSPQRWWVAVDPRHVARLRRLLEGPPRAAES